MAYIVTVETTVPDGAVNNTDVSIPVGHKTDDLCVILVGQDGGATTISTPSGFTAIGTQAVIQGQRIAAFQKVLTSSSEPDVNMTGTTDEWVVATYLIRGADKTTPIGATLGTDSTDSTSNSLTLGGVTTTTANSLILWQVNWDNQYKLINDNTETSVTMTKEFTVGNCNLTGYYNQPAIGTTQNIKILSEVTSEGGSGMQIAINDATPSTPQMSPSPLQGYKVIARYGGVSTATTSTQAFTRHDGLTWSKVDGVIIPSTIGGISLLSSTTYLEATVGRTDSPWGGGTGAKFLESAIDATGRWVGGTHAIPSTDMRKKTFSVEFGMSSVGGQFGKQGVLVYFDDGTNWVAFQLSPKARMAAGRTGVSFIDVQQATPYGSGGTMNWGAVTRIAYLYHRVTTSASALDISVKNALLHDKTIVVDGCAGSPASPTFLNRLMGGADPQSDGHGAYLLAPIQGNGQVLAKGGIQYGDGTRPTYSNLSMVSHELPLRADASLKLRYWRVEDNAPQVDYIVKASAGDTFRSTSTIVATDTKQNYIIDAASSASAIYDFASSSIIGYNVKVNANVIINSSTLRGCSIDLTAGGLDGCSIREQRGAAKTTDPSKLSNNDFKSEGTGHAIEATVPGTFAFEGNEFTNYGAAGTTNAAFYNNSGGLIELVIPLGDATPTIRNSAGSSTIITQPTQNQKVTVTNLVVGSRLQIYDVTSNTELVNEIVASSIRAWEDVDPYVADRNIRVRVAYVDGTDAKQFIEVDVGTLTLLDTQISYRVNQVPDTTYISNGIDGSLITDITINDGTMLLELSGTSETWQRLYAYEMYWLYTSAGIEDLGQSIFAPDTANYLMDSSVLSIKNVSGSATIITGGWGRDRATGSTLDIIDLTGDPIFTNPPHVVPFATGSGVTPTDVIAIKAAVWADTDAYSGDSKGGQVKTASKVKLLL